MGTEVRSRPKASRRTVAAAVGVSLLLVLLIFGLAFANSVGAAKVAENAIALHWANATAGTSALTRAALAQATTSAELEREGRASPEDLDFALTQVAASYGELTALLEAGAGSASSAHLTHFLAPVTDAKEALEAGDVETARSLLAGDVEAAYIELVKSIKAEQAAIQALIDENTAAAGRLNSYAVFFVTFAHPGAAVMVYWWIARRQVRELRIKADSALQAERAISRAKDAFVAGLSHELRTPLTSIYGFAEILTDGGLKDREQGEEVAQIIANEAAEMTRMVDDLLTASRLESTGIEIDMAPTRLGDIVESAITPFERAGLEVSRNLANFTLSTDGVRLRHIVVNLLSNAARHGGDTIGIEVTRGDDMVDIEVWDNGEGVSEEKLEKLFDRFIHSGAEPLLTGSVGLGLAVASRLASMLGGRLSYQRFSGKTYFTLNLPVGVESGAEAVGDDESVADMIKALSA